MFEQFSLLLNGLEDGEGKTNLVKAFEKLQGIHTEAIESRDKSKGKLNDLTNLIDGIKSATGLDELSVDSINGVIKNGKKSSDEVDTLNNQITELRGKYETLETEHNTYKADSEKKNFELAISRSDIFKDVSSDPFLRNAVMQTVTNKLIQGEDGNLYAKGDDGKVLNDLVSGKPITGQDMFSKMVESGSISKAALNSTVGNGGGGNPHSRPSNNGGKLKDLSEAGKANLIKEIGNEAYLQRVNQELGA